MCIQILGIGCDIESVDRFRDLDQKRDERFLQKIFTDEELRYCYSSNAYASRLAARFSAKEAVIKALSDMQNTPLVYRDIEIIRDRKGKTTIRLHNMQLSDLKIHVSLSHTRNNSLAFILITKETK
jgi:holo-[acyl-carrier protein] synthase